MSSRLLVPGRPAIAVALTEQRIAARSADLAELPRRGLAHRHWRLRGRGLVVRVPILRTGNGAALAGQAEIFRRAAPSGHTPALYATLAPAHDLPLGALVVAEIRGRQPVVPRDLPAIAAALAAIHDLPVPPPSRRAPLQSPDEPFAATLALIEANLKRGASALDPPLRALLDAERDWARGYAHDHAAALRRAPRALVVTDAHPRNFVIAGDGRAICLDLERALYGAPAIDLAHATLPISVAWGASGERVGEAGFQRFLAAYFRARGLAAERALSPFLAPFRRLTALRTTAAYATFRVSGAERALGPVARAVARRAIARALDAEALARFLRLVR